jgi:hypothetical protein
MLALVEEQEPLIDELRSRLGEDRYDAARAQGAALAYDDLVQFTLAEIDAALAEDDW